MKTILPSLWLVACLCGSAVATESQHSVVVDTPEVITLTHATPDTWHTLPPVQPYHVHESAGRLTYAACRSGVQLVFALMLNRAKFLFGINSVDQALCNWFVICDRRLTTPPQ